MNNSLLKLSYWDKLNSSKFILIQSLGAEIINEMTCGAVSINRIPDISDTGYKWEF